MTQLDVVRQAVRAVHKQNRYPSRDAVAAWMGRKIPSALSAEENEARKDEMLKLGVKPRSNKHW